jgi:hypothetical protein
MTRGVIAVLLLFSCSGHAANLILLPADARALITTPLDPANYVVSPPSIFNGVARLIVNMPSGTYSCSGTLLGGGQYLVTAAHCLTDDGPMPSVTALTATFNTAGGPQTFVGADYHVAPGWTGDFQDGSDIALVRLATPAAGIAGYDIWRGADPFGAVVDVAGLGRGGFGATGHDAAAYPSGTLRAGVNDLDPRVWDMTGLPYAWDFDNGSPDNDALCLVAGACGLGQGDGEVMIAPGDSGGPTFYLGHLLGVHSFGASFGSGSGDIDGLLNASFGELAGDTRTGAYLSWIDSIAYAEAPEPASLLLMCSGLAALLCRARSRRVI